MRIEQKRASLWKHDRARLWGEGGLCGEGQHMTKVSYKQESRMEVHSGEPHGFVTPRSLSVRKVVFLYMTKVVPHR